MHISLLLAGRPRLVRGERVVCRLAVSIGQFSIVSVTGNPSGAKSQGLNTKTVVGSVRLTMRARWTAWRVPRSCAAQRRGPGGRLYSGRRHACRSLAVEMGVCRQRPRMPPGTSRPAARSGKR